MTRPTETATVPERKALRVLHVISGIDPRNGGPTAALLGLVRAQVRAGLRVAVASTWKDPDAHTSADRLREYGAEPHLIGPARGKLSRHPDLVATIDRLVGQADVVHTHAMWEEIQHQACRAAQRQGVPYVMTPHGMLDPWNMGKNVTGVPVRGQVHAEPVDRGVRFSHAGHPAAPAA